jgi:hypothetical protein
VVGAADIVSRENLNVRHERESGRRSPDVVHDRLTVRAGDESRDTKGRRTEGQTALLKPVGKKRTTRVGASVTGARAHAHVEVAHQEARGRRIVWKDVGEEADAVV